MLTMLLAQAEAEPDAPFGGWAGEIAAHAGPRPEPPPAPLPLRPDPPPWSENYVQPERLDPAELEAEPPQLERPTFPPPDWASELGVAIEDEEPYPKRKERPC